MKRVCARDDMDEQCLRLISVGDAVVRHRFGVVARKSVTRMRGQGSARSDVCALPLQK